MNEIKTYRRKRLADTHTPVSIYLKVRDHYDNPVLLESNDSRSRENCHSFISLDPIAGISIKNGIATTFVGGKSEVSQLGNPEVARAFIENFFQSFQCSDHSHQEGGAVANGFFGYMSFDAVQYFDTLDFSGLEDSKVDKPDFHYNLYRYVIAIDHYKEELYLQQNCLAEEAENLDQLEAKINRQSVHLFPFSLEGDESSDLTDEEFMAMVTKGKEHCKRGDVFQLVLARRFQQGFQGDEFNVYRILRSINPSPYLFYFDGTYRRTGDDAQDAALAKKLLEDPKEIAEHTMLVDLARNDLSRSSINVKVSAFKEVHYFSHVIHLVSHVDGQLKAGESGIQVLADTFPAGTLSGAPKYRAIELINQYEKHSRGFYGGAIGYVGFDGTINHAITIRSFLSKDNKLYYQAGAGVVGASDERSEMEEVKNKLAALKKAFIEAEKLK